MGSAISGISNAVSQGASNIYNDYSGAVNSLSQGDIGGTAGRLGAGFADVTTGGQATNLYNNLTGAGQSGPQAPGTNPSLSSVEQQQINQANDFSANMPTYQSQMTDNLKTNVNNQLGSNLNTISNNNNARGLLYGGVNQGQRAQAYGQAQAQTAQGVSNINAGLLSAQDQLNANAVGTGTGIQQSSQAIQNDIYQQTLSQINSNNAMLGSAGGSAVLAGLLLA